MKGSGKMATKGSNATLTVKQEKFVQGLFTGLSQREAYKQAYDCKRMADKTIDEVSCKLSKSYKVATRLEELQNELKERNIVSVEWVLNNLKEVAERCMQAEPVLIRDGDSWIESGEYQFAHSGANKSLELIGKHLGMFTDKIEVGNKDNKPFEIKDVSLEEKLELIESIKSG